MILGFFFGVLITFIVINLSDYYKTERDINKLFEERWFKCE